MEDGKDEKLFRKEKLKAIKQSKASFTEGMKSISDSMKSAIGLLADAIRNNLNPTHSRYDCHDNEIQESIYVDL